MDVYNRMYMRYWKGPGNPYPARFHVLGEDVCIASDREANVGKMFGMYKEQILPSLSNISLVDILPMSKIMTTKCILILLPILVD